MKGRGFGAMALSCFAAAAFGQMSKVEEREAFHRSVTGMPAAERLAGFELRKRMEAETPFASVLFRSVGPERQGGRIIDLASIDNKPATLIVAFATGGLWRTDNMGETWASLFDRESTIGIGDIAVSGDGKTIWVGTGEANSSRTSYAGTGIFKSMDSGKTWANKGLHESHHIGRVVVHPTNPKRVFVASLGHLYSWNKDRGVYRTDDAGETWQQVLSVNERTGAIDIAMDPSNPDVVYASMWERDRRAWNFLESGGGTGLYKSVDGGNTWKKLGGLPDGQYVGRIGISVSPSAPNTLYALIDNQGIVPSGTRTVTGLTGDKLREMNAEQIAALDVADLDRLFKGTFSGGIGGVEIKQMLVEKKLDVNTLADHLGDANSRLLTANVIGAELYRSNDAGATWAKTHAAPLPNMYSTYGYYFGQVGVTPNDPEVVYILGVPLMKSVDGGKTFQNSGRGTHADHHAILFDEKISERVTLGNDGGLYLSWDAGANWRHVNNLPVGQFTTLAVDMATPYNIYGGLQDNGTMRGPSTYVLGRSDPWEWTSIGGGDGSDVQADPRDNTYLIVASQFGFGSGRDASGGWGIRPLPVPQDKPLQFNWVSPILMSPHNPDVVYFGSSKVFRSVDRGRTFQALGDELIDRVRQGDVPFGTVTSVSESPFAFGTVYAGTDQGKVWVNESNGDWRDISRGLAKDRWVTRVAASLHVRDKVYASQNGYRQDDFAPYLWRSDDGGKTWRSIAKGLPAEPINVIAENPRVAGMLFVGTDLGVFVSLNDGETWAALAGGLPHVPVHDLVVHPREKDLVVATHGRSVWIADISSLEAR
ncbi:MAG: glycosyl hydrolase [Armatimonadota bacterium]|nr:glycosyl hydrolase [Armatimonadota bacterium]